MKLLTYSAVALSAVAILTAATGNRQVTDNPKSPSADTSVKLGGKDVVIEYNAPSMRDRKVEGGLIPYDHIYRMGADAATTLTTETDLTIGNLNVPKGVYTLYLQAKESGPWQLAVNKQTKQWGTMYNQAQDLGRADMKVTKLDSPVEVFKITLSPKGGQAAELVVEWGHSKASVPIRAH
ncbi:MAG TPA: DUF2911 domain-containing protein [Bryobacteraceae bacterium]|jgi:hypothetical protein